MNLSVIIPIYNAEKTLQRCLSAVQTSVREKMEVILVDDGSTDASLRIASEYPFKILRMEKNSGAGAARNRGVEEASGEIILFVDSDVVVRPDTFERILQTYYERPEIGGVSAIYSEQPMAPGFYQDFKSLEETCKYEAHPGGQYNLFDPHCGSVRRHIFFEVGGFNPWYRGADQEDAEFGYKMRAMGYLNILAHDIKVDHIYASFRGGWWRYCRRSFLWSRLFIQMRRFQFDQAITTKSNAFSVFLALTTIGTGFLGLIIPAFLTLAVFALVGFILWNMRLIRTTLRYRGLLGVLKLPLYFFFLLSLHFAVGLGVATGLIRWTLMGNREIQRKQMEEKVGI